MADTAAHLVDRVLPHVPVRQWVLSLPIRLRYLLAFDRELCRRARRIFARAILGLQRRRARAEGIEDPEVGAVTVVQRFESSLNLNVHFHSLVLDGVFHRSSVPGELHFRPLPAPSPEDLAVTLIRVRSRILALLRRRGLDPAEFRLDELPLPADSATLGACLAASLHGRVALGPRSGQPLPRRGDPTRARPFEFPEEGCVQAQGDSLHANVAVPARHRGTLERLFRYLMRPPLSNDRLSPASEARLAVELKSSWSDGTTHVLFSPQTLLERLAALVPPPRAHLIVYDGVLAPASALRPGVVGWHEADAGSPDPPPRPQDPQACTEPSEPRARNDPWAELMKRVFAIDVLACPSGATRSLIAVITQAEVTRRILDSMGLAGSLPDEASHARAAALVRKSPPRVPRSHAERRTPFRPRRWVREGPCPSRGRGQVAERSPSVPQSSALQRRCAEGGPRNISRRARWVSSSLKPRSRAECAPATRTCCPYAQHAG